MSHESKDVVVKEQAVKMTNFCAVLPYAWMQQSSSEICNRAPHENNKDQDGRDLSVPDPSQVQPNLASRTYNTNAMETVCNCADELFQHSVYPGKVKQTACNI